VRYGGNTSCIEVRSEAGTLLILEGGSGLYRLGRHLMEHEPRPIQGYILLSHTHWDHIQGLPFFGPAYEEGNRFQLMAPRDPETPLQKIIAGAMSFENPPYSLDRILPQVEFQPLDEGVYQLGDIKVTAQFVNHTAICMGYRLEADGRVLTYCSDVEPSARRFLRSDSGDLGEVRRDPSGKVQAILHREDARLVALAQGAHVYIQDAQYTPEEYQSHRGWGHSPCDFATDVALAAEVGRFVLFHHDPAHTDEFIDRMVESCRRRAARFDGAPEILAAAEGLELVV
jgi:phosphoribosyl 1,2-cyclic phosphodiesterase